MIWLLSLANKWYDIFISEDYEMYSIDSKISEKDKKYLNDEMINIVEWALDSSISFSWVESYIINNLNSINNLLYSRTKAHRYISNIDKFSDQGIEIVFYINNSSVESYGFKYTFNENQRESIQEKKDIYLNSVLTEIIEEEVNKTFTGDLVLLDPIPGMEKLQTNIYSVIQKKWLNSDENLDVTVNYLWNWNTVQIQVKVLDLNQNGSEKSNTILKWKVIYELNISKPSIDLYMTNSIVWFESQIEEYFNTKLNWDYHYYSESKFMELIQEYIEKKLLIFLNDDSNLSAYNFKNILSIEVNIENGDFFIILECLDIKKQSLFNKEVVIFSDIDTIDPMRIEFKKLNSIFSDIIWNLPKKQFSFDEKSPDLKSYIMNQIILSIEKDIDLNLNTILIDFDIILNNGKFDFDFTFDSNKYWRKSWKIFWWVDVYNNYMWAKIGLFENAIIEKLSNKWGSSPHQYLSDFIANIENSDNGLQNFLEDNKTDFDREIKSINMNHQTLSNWAIIYDLWITYNDWWDELSRKITLDEWNFPAWLNNFLVTLIKWSIATSTLETLNNDIENRFQYFIVSQFWEVKYKLSSSNVWNEFTFDFHHSSWDLIYSTSFNIEIDTVVNNKESDLPRIQNKFTEIVNDYIVTKNTLDIKEISGSILNDISDFLISINIDIRFSDSNLEVPHDWIIKGIFLKLTISIMNNRWEMIPNDFYYSSNNKN